MAVSDQVTFANQTPLRIGAVTLAVRDVETVAAFYRKVMGLEPIEGEGDRVNLGIAGTILLELEHRPQATIDDPGTAGLFHTAFLMPDRAELARWLRHFDGLGLSLDGASDHLVSEAIYLSDPEGNGIEVYADRPREAWRFGKQGLDMGTYRLDMADLLGAAGGAPDFAGAPSGLRIGHIHLRVGDLAQAEAFYSGLLGMEVTTRVPGATFMAAGGYHHHIGSNIWRSRGAGMRDPNRAGLACFEIEASPEGFAELNGRLADAAVPVDDLGGRLALADPWATRITVQQVS